MFLSFITNAGVTMEKPAPKYIRAAGILIDRYFALVMEQGSEFSPKSTPMYDVEKFLTYLKSFQRHNGIKEDGKLGLVTWRYLFRIYEEKELVTIRRSLRSPHRDAK